MEFIALIILAGVLLTGKAALDAFARRGRLRRTKKRTARGFEVGPPEG